MSPASQAQLLPATLRAAVPWKNGGGLTREIAAFPPGAALHDFDWRASTAEVRSAGAFSVFAGVERTLCVLEGRLQLAVPGRPHTVLAARSAPFIFDGELAAHADPGNAPVHDLNVMTRRGRFTATIARLEFAGHCMRHCAAATTLVFALTPICITTGAETHVLSRWDALRVTGAAQCALQARAGRAEGYLIEISPVAEGSADSSAAPRLRP